MTTVDIRPTSLRVLNWVGVLVLLAIGLPLTVAGLLGLGTGLGRGLLCAGLVLLVSVTGGLAREVVEARVRRDPPQPRLEPLGGEHALHLPRAPGPTFVSSWMLAGMAAVSALAALFTALDQQGGWTCVLALLAAWLGWTSAVRRGGRLAGGLWLTPTRLLHEERGVTVDVSWDGVTGVVPQHPMSVLLRADRPPAITRTGPRGRAWRPVSRDGTTLTVDARHLAGGSTVASYAIAKAVTDPASRRLLGTPESLPPT